MKHTILLLLSLLSINTKLKAQNEKDAIKTIEKYVLKIKQDSTLKSETVNLFLSKDKYDENNLVVYKKANDLLKIEYYEKRGWAGGYEKTFIYVRNSIPVLVEKEYNEVVTFCADGLPPEKTLFKSKTYIFDWGLNKYKTIYETREHEMLHFIRTKVEEINNLATRNEIEE